MSASDRFQARNHAHKQFIINLLYTCIILAIIISHLVWEIDAAEKKGKAKSRKKSFKRLEPHEILGHVVRPTFNFSDPQLFNETYTVPFEEDPAFNRKVACLVVVLIAGIVIGLMINFANINRDFEDIGEFYKGYMGRKLLISEGILRSRESFFVAVDGNEHPTKASKSKHHPGKMHRWKIRHENGKIKGKAVRMKFQERSRNNTAERSICMSSLTDDDLVSSDQEDDLQRSNKPFDARKFNLRFDKSSSSPRVPTRKNFRNPIYDQKTANRPSSPSSIKASSDHLPAFNMKKLGLIGEPVVHTCRNDHIAQQRNRLVRQHSSHSTPTRLLSLPQQPSESNIEDHYHECTNAFDGHIIGHPEGQAGSCLTRIPPLDANKFIDDHDPEWSDLDYSIDIGEPPTDFLEFVLQYDYRMFACYKGMGPVELQRRRNLFYQFRKWKKRRRKLYRIVVTERAKKEMADQESSMARKL